MQTKTFTLLALSASAVLASPFHKRQVYEHRHFHGTGVSSGVRPTGTGHFPAGNSTEGLFGTGTGSIPVLTKTVSPVPQESGSEGTIPSTFANVASSPVAAETTSSCVSTSIATETSTNYVTVTATGAELAVTKVADAANTIDATAQVSPAQFWGSKSNGGWSQSAAASTANSAAKPSTTFATMASSVKSSSAAASATSAPSTGSSGGKRGVSYNSASLVSAFGSSVSWAYNWATTSSGLSSGVEFVPMCWGLQEASTCASKFGSASHVLSFNEPDLGTQANIDPQTAATKHKEVFGSLKGKMQIGSPAVTNGATTSPPMGVNWLDQFFNACGADCPVDFVAYHWYATADSIEYFKQHTKDIIAIAAKHGVSKVWLTEFAPTGGSASDQASFMQQAVDFLDSTAEVERYAAFMASDGTLLSGSSLNSVGSAYASA
ncbi:hypothetical protein H2198_001971 [Neophaeococcomyces mojaviensis]|uniref:Uncharacterized protein n=1 Tax=Neophaeococcomyces mojaviensis TaxID=3383035 RepID=A0ACC3AFH8_9EURO|nr:hypothetical protein H2198_001971 [Knufia sp. JES_112]